MLTQRSINENSEQKALIVGCGWKATHGHDACAIHPAEKHFTIDINPKMEPDLVADFTQEMKPFAESDYDLIILETFSGKLNHTLFQNINSLLSENGICVIYWTQVQRSYDNVFRNMQANGFESVVIEKGRDEGGMVFIIRKSNEENLLDLEETVIQDHLNRFLKKKTHSSSRQFSTPEIAEKFEDLKYEFAQQFIGALTIYEKNVKRQDSPYKKEVLDIVNERKAFLIAQPSFFSPAYYFQIVDDLNTIEQKYKVSPRGISSQFMNRAATVVEDFTKRLSSFHLMPHVENQQESTSEHFQHQLKQLLNDISEYIVNRDKDPRKYRKKSAKFFGGYDKGSKLKAANALKSAVMMLLERGTFDIASLNTHQGPLNQGDLKQWTQKFNLIRKGAYPYPQRLENRNQY